MIINTVADEETIVGISMMNASSIGISVIVNDDTPPQSRLAGTPANIRTPIASYETIDSLAIIEASAEPFTPSNFIADDHGIVHHPSSHTPAVVAGSIVNDKAIADDTARRTQRTTARPQQIPAISGMPPYSARLATGKSEAVEARSLPNVSASN